jgi:P27 family predicted phage terminase small subunit|tara:strand:+ start:129 stop:602 length:474 start_codon:yes stop_codon:yes gene_type:complete
MKGRKKIPTAIKKAQGTDRKDRELDNEMTVSNVVSMPNAPLFLNDFGSLEWNKVTNELANLSMLHDVDLGMLASYCREMGTYFEMVEALKGGQVERTYDKDGKLRATKLKPEVKIARDCLDRAIKLAVQFGFTPSSRASLSMPEQIEEVKNKYDFFD